MSKGINKSSKSHQKFVDVYAKRAPQDAPLGTLAPQGPADPLSNRCRTLSTIVESCQTLSELAKQGKNDKKTTKNCKSCQKLNKYRKMSESVKKTRPVVKPPHKQILTTQPQTPAEAIIPKWGVYINNTPHHKQILTIQPQTPAEAIIPEWGGLY